MWHQYSVHALRKMIANYKKGHNIFGYYTMKKAELIAILSKRFTIVNDELVGLEDMEHLSKATYPDGKKHDMSWVNEYDDDHEERFKQPSPVIHANNHKPLHLDGNLDFNVGKTKKTKVKNASKLEKEVDIDRRATEQHEKKHRDMLEKQSKLKHLETMKSSNLELKSKLDQAFNDKEKSLKDNKSIKGLRQNVRIDNEQKILSNYHSTVNNIKSSYKPVYDYMKQNKLADFNQTNKHLRTNISNFTN